MHDDSIQTPVNSCCKDQSMCLVCIEVSCCIIYLHLYPGALVSAALYDALTITCMLLNSRKIRRVPVPTARGGGVVHLGSTLREWFASMQEEHPSSASLAAPRTCDHTYARKINISRAAKFPLFENDLSNKLGRKDPIDIERCLVTVWTHCSVIHLLTTFL